MFRSNTHLIVVQALPLLCFVVSFVLFSKAKFTHAAQGAFWSLSIY